MPDLDKMEEMYNRHENVKKAHRNMITKMMENPDLISASENKPLRLRNTVDYGQPTGPVEVNQYKNARKREMMRIKQMEEDEREEKERIEFENKRKIVDEKMQRKYEKRKNKRQKRKRGKNDKEDTNETEEKEEQFDDEK